MPLSLLDLVSGIETLARPKLELDRELPFIFTETLGAWAAKEREHVVPRMYRTTASDSESGSDGEEDDDI